MAKDDNFFEDFSKFAGSAMDNAVTSMAEFKSQCDEWIKEHVETYIKSLDLVSKEEFSVVKEMASKAREENAELKKQIAAIEDKLKSHKHD